MAVDTKAKRFSATQLLFPGYTQAAVPTGTVSRPAAAWMYDGIVIASGALATGVVNALMALIQPSMTMTLIQPSAGMALTQPAANLTMSAGE